MRNIENEVDGFVSSRDGDYFTPYVSPSHFDDLSMTREETPYVNVNEERKKKMGRKRRSDNWRRIGKVNRSYLFILYLPILCRFLELFI